MHGLLRGSLLVVDRAARYSALIGEVRHFGLLEEIPIDDLPLLARQAADSRLAGFAHWVVREELLNDIEHVAHRDPRAPFAEAAPVAHPRLRQLIEARERVLEGLCLCLVLSYGVRFGKLSSQLV